MLDATKLILSRMETNPEEFGMREGKWAHIVNYFENILPSEDLEAIKTGFNKCRQQEFTEEVLKALANEHDKKISRKREIGVGTQHEVSFGQAVPVHADDDLFTSPPVKREGDMVSYDSATDSWRHPPKKISLTAGQIKAANKMGVSLTDYAKALKEEL